MRAKIALPFGHTSPVEIQDLGITLKLGQEITVDYAKASESACVKALLQNRRIVLLPIEKEPKMTQPKPTIHAVALSRPARTAPPQPTQHHPVQVGASAEEIASIVAKTVEAVLSRREASPQVQAPAPQINVEGLVERALEAALSRMPMIHAAGVNISSQPVDDGPLYIPSGIVTEKSVDIKTTSSSSAANELEDSLKALKSIPRPKRVKKEKSDEE